ncbi:hypothetical protein [Nostoc sp. FACHB-145]|uniref:hypothetical protein n=1 Tax=Nostoc sp. FACHB-145 TaxID=2692836 RepID=UPI0016873158|nr:hypothetical protein [Nostoc sp. FACHB-145]MBD2473247.1 hypothetical protein [Nostoc sp. FACHB-145]
MSKKSLPTKASQGKTKLGDQIRSIADRLKQETEVQIKATSRILGAAAQISENHDRLINEVVEMVEEDLNNEADTSQRQTYTVEALKKQYKTLKDAKAHFNLKANSWDALVNQLNALSLQSPVAENSPQSSQNLNGKQGNDRPEFERLAVFLEPDVAQMFPTSEAVNEALRFLIRVASKNLS